MYIRSHSCLFSIQFKLSLTFITYIKAEYFLCQHRLRQAGCVFENVATEQFLPMLSVVLRSDLGV
jgi:hypothetical protein